MQRAFSFPARFIFLHITDGGKHTNLGDRQGKTLPVSFYTRNEENSGNNTI